MIENLQDELYQLENKLAKLRAYIRLELGSKKSSKTFFKVLEREDMHNQTISEFYADDNKSTQSRLQNL